MSIWIWAGFLLFIFFLLALDLGVFHKKDTEMSTKESLTWTGIWISISLLFNVLIYFLYQKNMLHIIGPSNPLAGHGHQAALEFFTGYLIEKFLSVDNIFIIALIFSYFKVSLKHQHRILFWGILGAIIMRGALIAVGAALIHAFSWVTYVFGALLIFTAVKLLVVNHDTMDPDMNIFVRTLKKMVPISKSHDTGGRFLIVENGVRKLTYLSVALVVVEGTDLIFALDSIPAIFAVTRDPFIVFSSNIFAILGLRSLYFALASVLDKFKYLKTSLVFLLAFVGIKLILSHHYDISIVASLAVIIGILSVGVLASLVSTTKK